MKLHTHNTHVAYNTILRGNLAWQIIIGISCRLGCCEALPPHSCLQGLSALVIRITINETHPPCFATPLGIREKR